MRSPASKFFRAIPMALAVTFMVPVALPTVVEAQGVDEQRQRVQDIVDELERLEERARLLGEDYNEAIAAQQQLAVEIADAEERVAEKEDELAELRDNLSSMARRSFVGGGSVPLGPLFEDSENINDAVKREELARVALSAGKASTNEFEALMADINDEKKDLDRKRDQAQQQAESLTAAQTETERRTGEYTQARADAEAKLGRLIQEEEERRALESQRRMEAEAAEAAAAAAAAASASNANSRSNSNSSSGNSNSGNSNSGNSGNSNSGSSSSGSSDSGSSSSASSPSSASSGSSGSSGSGGGTSAPAPAPAPAPSPSSRAGIAVQAALSQQGVPYRYGTSIPNVSFDCSGLTSYAWAQAGVGISRTSRSQFASLPRVSRSAVQPGDLIFFYTPVSHVSLYVGNGIQVHAPNTGSVVHTRAVNWSNVVGVGRPG